MKEKIKSPVKAPAIILLMLLTFSLGVLETKSYIAHSFVCFFVGFLIGFICCFLLYRRKKEIKK